MAKGVNRFEILSTKSLEPPQFKNEYEELPSLILEWPSN